jgi:lipoprotein LenA
MKRIIAPVIAIIIAFTFLSGCKKKEAETQAPADTLSSKYAKFRANVYKDATLKTWLATLEKGEKVELVSEESGKGSKNEDIVISNIKLSDGKTGYIDGSYVAVKPVVITDQLVKAYERNNSTSAISATLSQGTIGFVVEEKGEWVKVDFGKIADKWVNGKWIKSGFSDNEDIVSDAVALEKVRNILNESAKGDKEEAMKLLRDLAQKSSAIGDVARKDLASIEGTAPAPDVVDGNGGE